MPQQFTPAELNRALASLAEGRLREAERLVAVMERDNPSTPDLLGLHGELEYKRGNPDAAGKWLDKALAVDRRHARSHWVLGNISQDSGQLDRAITSYRRALRAAPALREAHNDLGTAYFAKGWHAEAEQCYRQALALRPDDIAATENLASVLRAQGRIGEARNAFVRVLKLRLRRALSRFWGRSDPAQPATPLVRAEDRAALAEAGRLAAAGRFAEAEKAVRPFLHRHPDSPQGLHVLAVALAGCGQRKEAIAMIQRAISLKSTAPEYFVALGNMLGEERDYARALQAYQTALMLDPGSAPATANIAHVLQELGHYREAEEIYRLSLEHDPDLAAAHSNLAATLNSLGRYVEAEAAARKALELQPLSVHAAVILANALLEQGRIEEARQCGAALLQREPEDGEALGWMGKFETVVNADFSRAEVILKQASELAPESAKIHVGGARCLLIRQRFAEGWQEYEWRKREAKRLAVYTRFPQPEWDGSTLAGKAIAINGEQGLGDEIMFASCVPQIAARARRCVLLCHRRLEPLFRRSFAGVEVIGGSHVSAANDPFPALEGIDCQIAAGSLPLHLRRSAEDFPAHGGYLRPDETRVAKWREKLAALGPGPKIGLSWRGGTPLSDGTRRTLQLAQFRPLASLGGCWIDLQHGGSAHERDAGGFRLHHWDEAIEDLEEMAALVCALDLTISVCNTLVHLAGALGKEVWVAAPRSPDARYGFEGERMIWYPAVRMFRQTRFGDWSDVIDQLTRALALRMGR